MSDSRHVYRAISQALRQLYPFEPLGNLARHLNTLAGMVTGIVLGRSCQLPKLAHKAPDGTLAESRHKRFSRWVQNDAITSQLYFLPFVHALLTSLAAVRPLVLVMDGSLVTNLADRDDACRRYEKRAHIETLFSDKKSRGFQLDRSPLDDPERVHRLLIATCLAYLWLIYLGTLASQPHWRRLVHRSDRCDLSLFQLGLRLLEFWLDDDAPLRIAFLPQASQAQVVVKSVR